MSSSFSEESLAWLWPSGRTPMHHYFAYMFSAMVASSLPTRLRGAGDEETALACVKSSKMSWNRSLRTYHRSITES